MAFPSRVNLVFGETWCLAKLGSGVCAAEVVSVEVLMKRRAWKHADFRWLLGEADSRSNDYLIRTDHHPQRALRGGIPVMLDDVKFGRNDTNHLWYFEYECGGFYIRSSLSHMYLQVDASGKLVFETGRPELLWRWHDATKKYKRFLNRPRGKTEMPAVFKSASLATAVPDADYDSTEEYEQDKLETFSGSPTACFDALVDNWSLQENPFMPLSQLLEKHVELHDDSRLFPQGVTIHDVFPTLFGASSDLFRRFHERRSDRDLNFQPPQPLVSTGAPWGAVAKLTCKVPLPVLGLCAYKEVSRFVLCSQGEKTTLAVQIMGIASAGRFGEFPSEMVYLFSQINANSPIRTQVMAPAPSGTFAGRALDGYRKSAADFLAVAEDILQDWRPAGASAPPSPVEKTAPCQKELVKLRLQRSKPVDCFEYLRSVLIPLIFCCQEEPR